MLILPPPLDSAARGGCIPLPRPATPVDEGTVNMEHWRIIIDGEFRSTRRYTYPSTTSCTTDCTWTCLGSNPCLV